LPGLDAVDLAVDRPIAAVRQHRLQHRDGIVAALNTATVCFRPLWL
jgi:hypothetical protein